MACDELVREVPVGAEHQVVVVSHSGSGFAVRARLPSKAQE